MGRRVFQIEGAAAAVLLFTAGLAWAQTGETAGPEEVMEKLMAAGRMGAVQVLAHASIPAGRRSGEKQRSPFMVTNIGSGVRFGASNRVLTAYSVVADADSIEVRVGARSMPATLLGTDALTELALLSVNGLLTGNNPPPSAGVPGAPGDVVLLVDPLGNGPSLISGRITALEGPDLMFTDIKTYDGLSGAPLLNARGELVGVVTFVLEAGSGGTGTGSAVAIPASEAASIAGELEAHGRVRRGYFGAAADLRESGQVVLDEVYGGGPAEAAGLRPGDVITHYGGQQLRDAVHLRTLVQSTAPGTAVPMVASRDSTVLNLTVVLGNREEDAPRAGRIAAWPRGESETALLARLSMLLQELEALASRPDFDPSGSGILPVISRLEREIQLLKNTSGTSPPPGPPQR
ncbi:MAG: trypsin-like peptidase domain-containing protein [bacterium]